MRLWHKELITVLPREQLVAQWRECSAIAGAIQKNGTPNHILVDYVLEDLNSFVAYSAVIRREMTRRGYKTMDKVWEKIAAVAADDFWRLVNHDDIFPIHHNDRYLKQCYYNLQEKYDRGGISQEDWFKIASRYVLDKQEEVPEAEWQYWPGWASNHDHRIDDAICSKCGYHHTPVYNGPDGLSSHCPCCKSKMKKR